VKPLIISLGHRYRGDDGFGPRVLDLLRQRLGDRADYLESRGDSAALLSAWRGVDLAVLIDAMRAPNLADGTVVEIDGLEDDLPPAVSLTSSHSLNLAESLELGRLLGSLPRRLHIVAVAASHFQAGELLQAPVAAAVGRVAESISGLLANADRLPDAQVTTATPATGTESPCTNSR